MYEYSFYLTAVASIVPSANLKASTWNEERLTEN